MCESLYFSGHWIYGGITQAASTSASEQVANLMAQGMQKHEAKETVLPGAILLKPEPETYEDYE